MLEIEISQQSINIVFIFWKKKRVIHISFTRNWCICNCTVSKPDNDGVTKYWPPPFQEGIPQLHHLTVLIIAIKIVLINFYFDNSWKSLLFDLFTTIFLPNTFLITFSIASSIVSSNFYEYIESVATGSPLGLVFLYGFYGQETSMFICISFL